jgi:hypothetical protein
MLLLFEKHPRHFYGAELNALAGDQVKGKVAHFFSPMCVAMDVM